METFAAPYTGLEVSIQYALDYNDESLHEALRLYLLGDLHFSSWLPNYNYLYFKPQVSI